ncbi:MAG: prolyl oligopeptidase family serine peptidase [bacterium]|nr:prolyl oligopeptidase family serine peptidase [bacterium]
MAIREVLLNEIGPITDTGAWCLKRDDIKKRLYKTIGKTPYERNTRRLNFLSEEDNGSYTRHRIEYVVGDGDIISAFLLVPKGMQEKIPAVLAMHQTVESGKDEVAGISGFKDFAYGHELAMHGYVVLIPDYLTAGERILVNENSFDSTEFYKKYSDWSMVGKNVDDSMAGIDILCMLSFVDKNKIGVIGHSHGGHNAIFAMGIDDRISVGVSNCGLSAFSEEEKRLEWSLDKGYIYIPALREYFLADKLPPFDINEIAALIAPKAWLNISSYHDVVYGNQRFLTKVGIQLYEVYDLYKCPEKFSYVMHGNGHSFPTYARVASYAWMDRFLK